MRHLQSELPFRFLVLAGMLGLSLLMAGCVPVPITSTPVSTPTPSQLPVAILEIGGIGNKGMSTTLQIHASDAAVDLRFSADAKKALSQTFARSPYLEYALVYQGSQKWQLFYATPPTGVITPTSVQAHFVESGSTGQLLLASGPVFNIASATPISTTSAAGANVTVDDGIRLINSAMGWPVGEVFGGEAAFLLLSDGKAENPNRTLVIFGSIQPNGDLNPPAPGGPFDYWYYCQTVEPRPSWCLLVLKLVAN